MTDDQSAAAPLLLASAGATLDALTVRLAAQIAPWRWRKSLEQLADSLEAGKPLEVAVPETRMPHELECWWREALKLPDPPKFVLDALRARSEVKASWNEFIGLVSYPIAMLLLAVVVGAAFSYGARGLIDFSGVTDFGLKGLEEVQANIDDQHAALSGVAMIVGWTALVLVTITLVGPPWAWTAIMGGVFMIGTPLRWISLQELLHRYHLFTMQGVFDGNVGQAVSRSFSRSSQSIVAENVAQRIDAGMPIGRALAASILSDGLCRPSLLLLDEQNSQTTHGFLRTARLLGRLAEQRCRVLGMIMPVVLLLIVGTLLWATINCYIMVFLPMITVLNFLA